MIGFRGVSTSRAPPESPPMPKEAKPYKYRNHFVTDAGGVVHHRLCRVEEGMAKAKAEPRLWVAKLEEIRRERGLPGLNARHPPPPERTVAEACDAFMDHVEAKSAKGKAHKTYTHYKGRLQTLVERFGGRPLASLTFEDGVAYKKWLMHEKEWKKGKKTAKGVSPTTVNHNLRA